MVFGTCESSHPNIGTLCVKLARMFRSLLLFAFTLANLTSSAFAAVVPFDPKSCESLLLPDHFAAATLKQDGFEIFDRMNPLSDASTEILFAHLSSLVESVRLNSRMTPFLVKDLKAQGELLEPVRELYAYIARIQREIESRLPEDGPLVLDSAELRISTGAKKNEKPFKIGYHFDGGWVATTVAFKGTATFLRDEKRPVLPPRKIPLVFSALDKTALTGVAPTNHGQPYGLEEERFLLVLRFLPKYKFRSVEQLSQVQKGLVLGKTFEKVIPFFNRRDVKTSRHVELYETLYDANLNGECYRFTFIESQLSNWSKVSPDSCTPL